MPYKSKYSGFNTKKIQEGGKMLEKTTKSVYLPLIDAKPSDASTMMEKFPARILNEFMKEGHAARHKWVC